jgi:hypothetical protein
MRVDEADARFFLLFHKYIFFFFEANPKTGKMEVGRGTLVVMLGNDC